MHLSVDLQAPLCQRSVHCCTFAVCWGEKEILILFRVVLRLQTDGFCWFCASAILKDKSKEKSKESEIERVVIGEFLPHWHFPGPLYFRIEIYVKFFNSVAKQFL